MLLCPSSTVIRTKPAFVPTVIAFESVEVEGLMLPNLIVTTVNVIELVSP